MGLFSSKQTPPPTVSTDHIIPFRFTDDFAHTRGLCLDVSLRFDDVLDSEKLRAALDQLLQKDGWRKLGARLRLNKDNKLEYHVPAEFNEKRPAFLYTTDKHDGMSIDDHPVLSKLPKGNGEKKPAVVGHPLMFRSHMRASNAPEYIQDWLYSDFPQLAIHVVNFNDATIINVTFMHTLTDAMGFVAFLRAWTAVLRGDEDQIPPFVGFDIHDDPTETLHQGTPASQYLLANRVVRGWRLFLFVARYIFELLWWPKSEMRTVFIPGEFVNKLRDSARIELAEAQSSRKNGNNSSKDDDDDDDEDPAKPFLSESDVICSWWARVVVRALNPSPQRTVCLMNMFDARGLLAEMGRIPSADAALTANAIYTATSLIPAGEFSSPTVPLSSLANQVRTAITTLRTKEQLQAQVACFRESVEKTGHPPIYGDSSSLMLLCSNWHRGKLFQMDFSSAVVATQKKNSSLSEHAKDCYHKGKPSFISSTLTASGFPIRNSQVIIGKDLAGNWWFVSTLRTGAWKKVAEQFKMM